jgi:hypothetical protein
MVTEVGVAASLVFLFVKSRGIPRRRLFGMVAILGAGAIPRAGEGRVLLRDRSFFGALKVDDDASGRFRRLVHGVTIHGRQSLDPLQKGEPLAYYHRTGPIGDIHRMVEERGRAIRSGVVGLGAGALAAYARPGDSMVFYEIDPVVERVAEDPALFSYLSDCQAGKPPVVRGDARLRLREARPGSYDMLVLDAFSSDAIPVHLLTREALRLDREKLAPQGLIAVHISNRYLDLGPVLGALAADCGWVCLIREDLTIPSALEHAGKSASVWAILAERAEDLGSLASDSRWRKPPPCPASRVWTDDYSDIVQSFRWSAE